MNWLTNFVRPKIRALSGVRREQPDNLWLKCPSCGALLFHRDLQLNLNVCAQCGFHMKIGPKERLDILFDDGNYQLIELPKAAIDPLKFRDQKRYADRLKDAQAATGSQDAILVAHGEIGGLAAVVAVMDYRFIGGSMGVAVGEGIVAGARLALLQNAAFITVTASGGARMQEGMLSLMQMPRTVIAIEQVKEAGLPYIVLLTDPTTGGVSASFAMLGDIHMAEPGAQIGFAGARVIEETIRETLPDGFQRAEYLLTHGMVDMVVPRAEQHDTLARLLQLFRRPTPAAEIVAIPPGPEAKSRRAAVDLIAD
jgi:acetyl-CoA carboxylase carboxyl transferase subunit beta